MLAQHNCNSTNTADESEGVQKLFFFFLLAVLLLFWDAVAAVGYYAAELKKRV